jgi:predicted dehydrogenase
VTIRFGIIGTGYASTAFAKALGEATGAKFHSVLSRKRTTAEAFAARCGASRQHCHDSLESFLGDRYMDAVYIGTPPGLHADQADAAAAAGKHVFVEKPLATSSADCRRIIEACGQAGVGLGVGYQLRYHPLHEKARSWVQAGHIGEVVLARARWAYRALTDPVEWRTSKDLAGWWALGDLGTHCADLLRYILGKVESVTAVLRRPGGAIETEDTAVLFLRHESGTPSLVECSTAAVAPASLLEIVGTDGYIRATGSIGVEGEGELVRGLRDTKEEEFTDWSRPAAMHVDAIHDYLHALGDGTELRVSGEDGLRGVEILEAAASSSEAGGTTNI